MDIAKQIAKELEIEPWQVEAVISLIDEGNTIPFIARYRKEKHGELNDEQIRRGTEVCIAAGADFVKTSTGFNGAGATVEAVKAMLETANGRIKVKPSGGIRNYETAKMYVDMGASRLGCGYTSCKPICEGEGESSEAY